MPNLEQVGDVFFNCNRNLTELEMSELRQVGHSFLFSHETLNRTVAEIVETNRELKDKEQQIIDSNDILQLDKSNQMTTSEVTCGGKIISKMDRDRDKNER